MRLRSPARRPRAVRRALSAAAVAAAAALGIGARQGDPSVLLRDVLALVRDRFAGDGVPDVYEKAARGLVRELGDPYSELLSPRGLDDFARASLGRYAGVGMTVVPVGDSAYVGEVYATGPSAAAGLRHGDRLLRVDGASVAGLSLDSIVARLRGLPDTPVTVEVERAGAPASFALRRAVVRVPAVQYVLVDRGVAYMPLPSISETAGASVEAALSALAARPDVRGVVLDLRGNPGGAVDQAVRVVSALLPAGRPVLDIRERAGRTTLRTRGTPVAPALPAVVLQDGASASAAEIISGALQDHDRALVVGTRSYGKGLAQTLYPLDNGYALKLTTARWYTPVGRTIHRDRTAGDSARRASDGDRATLDSAAHVSVGGRALPGGGGIAPDLEVQYDTLPSAERDVAVRLRRGGDRAADAIARVALRLSRGADTAFRVTPAWRAALRGELAAAGVAVDSAAWERGAPYVTRLLEQRVADFAFGAAAARRRALAHDRHYLVADSILRAGVRLTPFTPARPA